MELIENKNLRSTLEIILNKSYNDITIDDLINLKNISFSKPKSPSEEKFRVEEILKMPNVTSLAINDSNIINSDLSIISKLFFLRDISFDNCHFDENLNFKELKKITYMTINYCDIQNYSFLKDLTNLENLVIVYPQNELDIDLNVLENLSNLKNFDSLKKLKKLENLYFITTSVPNIEFLKELANLKKVYIPDKYLNGIKKVGNIEILSSSIDLLIDDDYNSKGIV